MSSMAARNAVAVIKKVLPSGGVCEQEQREHEGKTRNKEGRMRRKSQREGNVFEMTCSPRHDSD